MKTKSIIILCLVGIITLGVFASSHQMHSEVEFKPCTIAELERFHGHVGPFVALGARIGEHAHTVYGIPRFFGLAVVVNAPHNPPPSCIIDGLQWSTGATYGKHNIEHHAADKIEIIIQNTENGDTAVYRLKETTTELIDHWAEENQKSIQERGELLFHMMPEELFDIEFHEGDGSHTHGEHDHPHSH